MVTNWNTVLNQTGIGFTKLFTKYPNENWYCSKVQGIVPTNLVLFLKAKKAVENVIAGQKVGSQEIQNSIFIL